MKHALIVWGGWMGHQPDTLAGLFAGWLRGDGFQVDVSASLDALKDVAALKQRDLIVPIWTMGKIEKAHEDAVSEAVASGVGLAGCHGGMCDAFRESVTWQFITGGNWVAHPGNDQVDYLVNIRHSSSPLVAGVKDFRVKSEQYYLHVDPAVEVLATTRFPIADGPHAVNGPVDMPVVWTKRWGRGRVYYNALGHSPDVFAIPEAKELMLRGLRWAADSRVASP